MTSRFAVTLFAALAWVLPALGQGPTPDLPPTGPELLPNPPAVGGPAAPQPAAGQQVVAPTQSLNDVSAASAVNFWTSFDYLFGFVRSIHAPPLVTTSPVGTPKGRAGVIGAGGPVEALFGDEPLNGEFRSGFKLGVGSWITDDHSIGWDAGFFMVESKSRPFDASSDGSVILARPFFDVASGVALPSSALIAFPGASSGSVHVSANSGMFYGAHFDLQEAIIENQHFRLKSLIGYRFLRFDDGLEVFQSISPTGGGFFPGTRLDARDTFAAHNRFHGCEIGFQTDFVWDAWSLNFLGKIAVGNLYRNVNIAGSSTTFIPGSAPVVSNGGLLALSSNIGEHSSNDWVGAPELNVNVGYAFSPNAKLRLGYGLLYLYDVARAAEQVDTTVNSNLFPPATGATGVQRPAFNLVRHNIFLQSINLGMEFTF